MPRPLTYNATLVERADLSPTLAIFRIRPDEVHPPDCAWFKPGQYVSLGLNDGLEEGAGSVRRAYSIASEPEERRWLEFYVRRVPRPASAYPFTHLLWEMKPGDRMLVGEHIAGHFTLEHTVGADDPRVKLLVAAGTGLAPFLSMVRSARRRLPRRPTGRLAVLHGASHAHELGHRKELEQALAEIGGDYLPTVSRPEASVAWDGATGRVESFLEVNGLEKLERRLGLPPGGLVPQNAVAFVCGLQGTIAEAIVRLARRGFVADDRRLRRLLSVPEGTPGSLFFEQYDNEPVIDPEDSALVERLRGDLDRAAG